MTSIVNLEQKTDYIKIRRTEIEAFYQELSSDVNRLNSLIEGVFEDFNGCYTTSKNLIILLKQGVIMDTHIATLYDLLEQ